MILGRYLLFGYLDPWGVKGFMFRVQGFGIRFQRAVAGPPEYVN